MLLLKDGLASGINEMNLSLKGYLEINKECHSYLVHTFSIPWKFVIIAYYILKTSNYDSNTIK